MESFANSVLEETKESKHEEEKTLLSSIDSNKVELGKFRFIENYIAKSPKNGTISEFSSVVNPSTFIIDVVRW